MIIETKYIPFFFLFFSNNNFLQIENQIIKIKRKLQPKSDNHKGNQKLKNYKRERKKLL